MKKRCYKLLTLGCVLCLAFSTVAFTGCGEKDAEVAAGSVVSTTVETGDSLSAEAEVQAEESQTEEVKTEEAQTEETDTQEVTKEETKSETKEETKTETKEETKTEVKEESKAEEKPSTPSTENTETKEEVKEEAPAFQTGKYSGSHKKYVDAMGQDVKYSYSITLNEDGSYKYNVSFSVTMGGETKNVTESESGTYKVDGSSISFSGDNGSFSGAISGNTISVNRAVSSFASDSVTIKLKH